MFNRDDNRSAAAGREEYTGDWVCSGCKKENPHSLPFKPSGDRPVYCRDCYKARKQEGR